MKSVLGLVAGLMLIVLAFAVLGLALRSATDLDAGKLPAMAKSVAVQMRALSEPHFARGGAAIGKTKAEAYAERAAAWVRTAPEPAIAADQRFAVPQSFASAVGTLVRLANDRKSLVAPIRVPTRAEDFATATAVMLGAAAQVVVADRSPVAPAAHESTGQLQPNPTRTQAERALAADAAAPTASTLPLPPPAPTTAAHPPVARAQAPLFVASAAAALSPSPTPASAMKDPSPSVPENVDPKLTERAEKLMDEVNKAASDILSKLPDTEPVAPSNKLTTPAISRLDAEPPRAVEFLDKTAEPPTEPATPQTGARDRPATALVPKTDIAGVVVSMAIPAATTAMAQVRVAAPTRCVSFRARSSQAHLIHVGNAPQHQWITCAAGQQTTPVSRFRIFTAARLGKSQWRQAVQQGPFASVRVFRGKRLALVPLPIAGSSAYMVGGGTGR